MDGGDDEPREPSRRHSRAVYGGDLGSTPESVFDHGFRFRMNGIPWFDEDGGIAGVVHEDPWKEADLTPEQAAEIDALVAEHRAARPQDDEMFARWATLEHNGITHACRRGRPVLPERPAYAWECAMCKAYVVNPNPGDYRFHGGPVDGRWLVTDGAPYWRVPVIPPLTVVALADDAPLIVTPYAEYVRRGDRYYHDDRP